MTQSSTAKDIDNKLIDMCRSTSKFLKQNRDIFLTRADKGNITVAINRSTYNRKMTELLNDTDTYTIIEKNPVKKLERDLDNLLKSWKNKEYIESKEYYRLRSNDKLLPKAYGVPKIHKIDNPLRIIVSSINTPLYSLALYLHKIIKNSLPKARSFVENSFDLYKKLTGFEIGDDDILMSLDVVSLFTNVPIELALNSLENRWSYIKKHTQIPQLDFINSVKFVLTSTYFTFNDIIYGQTFGTPMGSPLSPIIADIVLQDIENKALYKLKFNIPIYYRYVDDIFLVTKRDRINNIVETFNSYHSRLQFTYEVESEGRISFLDLMIININNQISID